MFKTGLALIALLTLPPLAHSAEAEAFEPLQRVVISDGYTSWLLKGDAQASERYGEGEALPRLLAEGWTIDNVSAGCGDDSRTVYVLRAPRPDRTGR